MAFSVACTVWANEIRLPRQEGSFVCAGLPGRGRLVRPRLASPLKRRGTSSRAAPF